MVEGVVEVEEMSPEEFAMNFPPISESELPLTAVADSPISGSGGGRGTTPTWRKHINRSDSTSSLIASSSSSGDRNTNKIPDQGPSPVVVVQRRWSYILPVPVTKSRLHHSRKKVTQNFRTSSSGSTSSWKSTKFDFEAYPAVLPFTMSPTFPSFSDDVEKHPLKSDEAGLFLPFTLLILGSILILGIVLVCVKRRLRLDDLRHKLLPVYHFASGEEDEWGVLLEDDDHFNLFSTYKIKNQK